MVFILISSAAFAQGSITVKGTVKDTKGEALVGAAVMLDGTSVGVVTDLDGKYTISFTPKAGKNPVLVYLIKVFDCTIYRTHCVHRRSSSDFIQFI